MGAGCWVMGEREEARREKRDSLGRRGEDFPLHHLANYPYPATSRVRRRELLCGVQLEFLDR